jgi:hypothetical protein
MADSNWILDAVRVEKGWITDRRNELEEKRREHEEWASGRTEG